jgi:hypothetical protein
LRVVVVQHEKREGGLVVIAHLRELLVAAHLLKPH